MDELEPDRESLVTSAVATVDGGTVVVTLAGELDMSGTGKLEADVASALAARPNRLIVDVENLRFADSSAIALWVRWAAITPEFKLRSPSPLVRRVVIGMGLAETLGMTP
jgi:anti-anti-sigma factor